MKAIDSWYVIFKKKYKISSYHECYNEENGLKECIMNSIMRQCQMLVFLNWDLQSENNSLLEIMQYKIKDLKITNCDHSKYYKEIEMIEYFKNHCNNISNLTIDKNIYGDKFVKDIISFIELQKHLNEFIFDVKEKEEESETTKNPILITSTLELKANNLIK